MSEEERRRKKTRRYETESGTSSEDDKFVGEEKTGKSVKKDIERHCDNYFGRKLQMEDFRRKLDKYPRPENIEKFKTPQTNQIVWEKMRTAARSTDIKIKRIQANITSSTTAFVKALEKTDDKDKIKQFKDGIAILGQTHFQLSELRKHNQKRCIPFSWRPIKELVGDEEDLYGPDDELRKRIKDLERDSTRKRNSFLDKSYGQERERRYFQNNQSRQYQPQPQQRYKGMQNQNFQKHWKNQGQIKRSPAFKKRV